MQNTQANPTSTLQAVKQAMSQGQLTTAHTKLDTLLADSTLTTGLKAECLYMRAVTHRLSKNYQAGLDDIASLLAIRPDHGRAFQEQAYLCKAQGDDKAAASAFYQATRFNPALLASWQQLLSTYQQQGNQQAAVLAEQHIAFLQSLPKPILGAYDLMYDGQLAAADSVCRRYLQQHKHDAEAMVLLAEIDMKLKAYHEAEFLLESCVAIYPKHDRAAAAYLSLLTRLGKYPQAEAFSRKRREQHPSDVAVMVAHASALVGIGKLDDAVNIYQELLEANRDRPAVWLALGHARKAKGDRDDAITAYETAIGLMPEFGDAYWSLANTKNLFVSRWVDSANGRSGGPKRIKNLMIWCTFVSHWVKLTKTKRTSKNPLPTIKKVTHLNIQQHSLISRALKRPWLRRKKPVRHHYLPVSPGVSTRLLFLSSDCREPARHCLNRSSRRIRRSTARWNCMIF